MASPTDYRWLSYKAKEDFLYQARLDIYSKMAPSRSDERADRRVFEPLSWIAYLYRRLIAVACSRIPVPIIAGVVERGGTLREFSETRLLERVFWGLRQRGNQDYFISTAYSTFELLLCESRMESRRLGLVWVVEALWERLASGPTVRQVVGDGAEIASIAFRPSS